MSYVIIVIWRKNLMSKKKIQICSDSSCDLGTALCERYDVILNPFRITLGDESLIDGVEVTPDDLYAFHERTGTLPKTSATNMAEHMEIDSFVSPKVITANRIIRYVRAMEYAKDADIKTLYKIVNGQVEALEFAIRDKSHYTDKPLKALKMKKGMLIACIIRHGRVIIPNGDSHLEVGDSVVIVTATDGYVKNLEDIFA